MRPFSNSTTPTQSASVVYRQPRISDGARLHQIAADSKVLDVNTPYAYVLWCHDFADTSVVAELDGRIVGFVSGYQRQSDPSVLMVWQVAVDEQARGRRVAAGMLHHLLDATAARGVTAMNTTISPDNEASQRLFESVATARGLRFESRPLFAAQDFTVGSADGDHLREDLYLLVP